MEAQAASARADEAKARVEADLLQKEREAQILQLEALKGAQELPDRSLAPSPVPKVPTRMTMKPEPDPIQAPPQTTLADLEERLRQVTQKHSSAVGAMTFTGRKSPNIDAYREEMDSLGARIGVLSAARVKPEDTKPKPEPGDVPEEKADEELAGAVHDWDTSPQARNPTLLSDYAHFLMKFDPQQRDLTHDTYDSIELEDDSANLKRQFFRFGAWLNTTLEERQKLARMWPKRHSNRGTVQANQSALTLAYKHGPRIIDLWRDMSARARTVPALPAGFPVMPPPKRKPRPGVPPQPPMPRPGVPPSPVPKPEDRVQ